MYFTDEDIRTVYRKLQEYTVKDSEFEQLIDVTKDTLVPVLRDGRNKLISVDDITKSLQDLREGQFININDSYGSTIHDLTSAINAVPENTRKTGAIITFAGDYGWEIWQFAGVLISGYTDPLQWIRYIYPLKSIINIPLEYEITGNMTLATAISKVKMKDRKLGLIITFSDQDSLWREYQFKGPLNGFTNPDNWQLISPDQSGIKIVKGPTNSRPTSLGVQDKGFLYYDTDRDYLISWDGAQWRNPDGTRESAVSII